MNHRRNDGKDAGVPWIGLWFLLDAVVALAPPIYWIANAHSTPIFGLPATLFYFLLVCVGITASVVVAYLNEPTEEESPR